MIADASRYQLAARAIARYTGAVRLLSDHPDDRHRLPARARRGDERAPRRPRPTCATSSGSSGPRFAAELAAEPAKTRRARPSGPQRVRPARRAARARRGLPRLKPDLGLMDFSDQIALARAARRASAPRWARPSGTSTASCCSTSTRTPRSRRRCCCAGCSPAPTPRPGRGHPVTAVGDPNQAIYGWRGASVSNILELRRRLPARRRRPPVPSYPLTVNRRSDAPHPGRRQRLARPLLAAVPQVQPLGAAPDAGEGEVRAAVPETYADELAWLPGEVPPAHAAIAEPSVARDRRAGPRQRPRRRRLRRAHRARDPGRDRRPPGPAAAARGRRGGRHP